MTTIGQWWLETTGKRGEFGDIFHDLKGAREKAEAAAAETEMEADSESEDEPDGAAGGRGEEESQGPSGSSGVEWSGAEYD